MRRLSLRNSVFCVGLCLALVLSVSAQGTTDRVADSSLSGYPDSPEGLKTLIDDILAAVKARRNDRVSELLNNLAIPDYKTWFVKEFGSDEGPRLAGKYQEFAPRLTFEAEKLFNAAQAEGRTEVSVTTLQKPIDQSVSGLNRAIVEAMQDPLTLYSASGRSPNQPYALLLGHYFYIEGGFRYLDNAVLQALSTAPPLRIKLGGQVVTSKQLHKVEPIYPPEARASRTEGPVVLHAIIGTDGYVKELNVMSGDPVLAEAAVTAVRQWQYRPTKLNDVPVEVDTTITITFRMR
jgi:TonB family protein